LLLLWIAWKILRDEATSHDVSERDSLFGALRTIILADVVMSLDNVLAIAGVSHGNVGQLLLGLLLSMPIILFSSGVIASVMNRFPWLSLIGAGILAWTAGGMIQEDDLVGHFVAMGTLADPLIPLALTFAIVAPSVRRLWSQHVSAGRISLRQRSD
jgi:predicted tellurium resistance membrane protein TerC